ncbi:protein D2-like [Diadema setosum]|uniref:protein D2-like n=1 Tax=Diadema setosum TaxID=31175 RepID=UPI003B3B8D70
MSTMEKWQATTVLYIIVACICNYASASTTWTENTCHNHSNELDVQYRIPGTSCTAKSSTSCIGDVNFSPGDFLPLSLFQNKRGGHAVPPGVKFCHAKEDAWYTLMMIDIDAPSAKNPINAPWLHWLVVNILGENLILGEAEGDTKKLYANPTPPAKSGYHRYEFHLFQQSGYLNNVETPSSRARFDVRGFERRYGLRELHVKNSFETENEG